MAKLKGALQMTGSIGGMSVYKMKGCDELIIRTKGGATREQIMTLESCSKVRKNNKEWSGVALMTGAIRQAVRPLTGLADYNFCGQLSAISKNIQKKDESKEIGQRSVYLSHYRELLSGFNLNTTHPFKSIVNMPVTWHIDREKCEAVVTIEKSSPAYQLKNFTNHPCFRIIVTLGLVSDMIYDAKEDHYSPVWKSLPDVTAMTATQWFRTNMEMTEQTLVLQAPELQNPIADCLSFVLGIGIEFATLEVTGVPLTNKVVGCGQILGIR